MDPDRIAELRSLLDRFPRAELVAQETPLDHLTHLGPELEIDLWLKRDDLTPMAFGGDKPRKLEFELGKALEQGADTIVTCGASQSNHARLTTAAARRLGLEAAVVLSRDDHTRLQGNLLAVGLMGARIVISASDNHWLLDDDIAGVMDDLRKEGRRPYFIPMSGTTSLSCLGYVSATLELLGQMSDRDFQPDVHYVPFGTGGIYTATMFTYRWLGIETPLVGVSVNAGEEKCREFFDGWWGGINTLLGAELDPDGFDVTSDYIGARYGAVTEAGMDAIALMARTEGILVDPVYSGKVLSALIDHVAQGRIDAGGRVLMLHSGGTPALFAYHEELEAHLAARGEGLVLGDT